jgi:hypothetical protein
MKQGAGDDLLDNNLDEGEDDDAETEHGDVLTDTTESSPDALDVTTNEEEEEIPYLLRRNQVKDQRKTVGFGLQKETRDLEDDILREVKADLDIETLPATDLREAAYLAGLQDKERLKQILLEWGYQFRTEG